MALRLVSRRRSTPGWRPDSAHVAASSSAASPRPQGAPTIRESWRSERDWLTTWGAPHNIVSGEAYRQDQLRLASGRRGRCLVPVNVLLEPEPDNAYDEHAIRALIDEHHVGYLRREIAGANVPQVRAWRGPALWVVAGVIRGGGDGYRLGVHLWPDRRVSPGPEFGFDRFAHAVSWPPHGIECVEAGVA